MGKIKIIDFFRSTFAISALDVIFNNDEHLIIKKPWEGFVKPNNNNMNENLNFGQVLEALKEGKRASRQGWNGKDMFIFQRPYDNIDIEVIPKIKSLPETVKKYFMEEFSNGETHFVSGNPIQVHFCEYLCMKDPNGNIVNGWLPSQTDIRSKDWVILD